MTVRLRRDLYRGIEVGERHGVLAAGMISRERTEVSKGRDVGRGVTHLAVGAGEAGTAGDGPPGGNCHHATRA